MDAKKNREKVKKEKGFSPKGYFDAVRSKRQGNREEVLIDAITFIVSLLFGRTHLIFGAYPLGIAIVAALPGRVWLSLAGVVCGALTLGRIGVIYSAISIIVVLMRIMLSSSSDSRRRSGGGIFSEQLPLRVAAACIGGFVAAVYELLLSSVSTATILFSLSMILFPTILCALFSGICDFRVSFHDLVMGNAAVFGVKREIKEERAQMYFFQLSALLFIFFISLSLSRFSVFGVSFSYIFSSFIALFTAKRFGAIRAMAVGFVGALPMSALYSAGFALSGLAAGILFPFGTLYGSVAAIAAGTAWCAFSSGVSGFVAVFPELLISSLLAWPVVSRIGTESTSDSSVSPEKLATDMVGTVALTYKNESERALRDLECGFSSLAGLVKKFGEIETKPDRGEYEAACREAADIYCAGCRNYAMCYTSGEKPMEDSISRISGKMFSGESAGRSDFHDSVLYTCDNADKILEQMRRAGASVTSSRQKERKMEFVAENYELIAKMLNEAMIRETGAKEMDAALTERLGKIFSENGFPYGVIRAFGDRKKKIIAAGEDKDGQKITSPVLHSAIAEAVGAPIGNTKYYRKDSMVLFECSTGPAYKVETAVVSDPRNEGEECGDTVRFFEDGDMFYAVLSDGMGSGEFAARTSEFCAEFLGTTVVAGASKTTSLHLLNHLIREKNEECSATVDMMQLDLVSGKTVFVKSGAAPSYVKRKGSLFRIRSQTVPIGLIKNLDAEKIKFEAKAGDIIFMLSDGVSQCPEDAPWLLELLNRDWKCSLKEIAAAIMKAAAANGGRSDDMTVAAIRISPVD